MRSIVTIAKCCSPPMTGIRHTARRCNPARFLRCRSRYRRVPSCALKGARRRRPKEDVHMTAKGLAAAVMLLAVVLAGPLRVSATPTPAPAGWAVLVEYNSFDGRYPDLPVGYVNSARMLDALMRLGWPQDHILLIRDSRDPAVLRRALAWLAGRVRSDDVALLYLAGEYQFFDRDLAWGMTMPALWQRVPTPHRVLIVETC